MESIDRKQDLEQRIRDAYRIIREYEQDLLGEDDPQRKARYRERIEDEWVLIDQWLEEYDLLCKRLYQRPAPDIAEIRAVRSSRPKPPLAPPPPIPMAPPPPIPRPTIWTRLRGFLADVLRELVANWVATLIVAVFASLFAAASLKGSLPFLASSTPTPTVARPTPAPSPTSLPTFTPRVSATPTASPTASPTPTATPSPIQTPTPALASSNLATATQSASIFAAPDANSRELAVVRTGEQVTVLGRSAAGRWFYVRNSSGVEGFAYAPRFDWSGDFEALPVKEAKEPVVLPTPIPSTVPSPVPLLEMDLWVLPGLARCDRINWYQTVYIAGRGGNGVYTYYWNGEKMAGPTGESYTFELYRATSNAIIGIGKVVSGDGQVVEKKLHVPVPDCFNK